MTSASDADEFTPTTVHEGLDRDGMLAAAHNPGCYALALDVPGSVETAERQWLDHFEAVPSDDAVGQLARADSVAYVGASGNVYDRLADHARADVRKASALEAFPPVEVVGLTVSKHPFEFERMYAHDIADRGFRVWCNGEVVG